MTNVTSKGPVRDRPMPAFFFWGMSAIFKIRDWVRPRDVLLNELPLRRGDTVLDYGCGPGSYIPGLAARVGQNGTVIAVDIHPLAIQQVKTLVKNRGLHNVRTSLGDGVHLPDLADASVDIVLLFDIFHMLGDQESVLMETYRVLRSGGTLAVNDHHMNQDDLAAKVTRNGAFRLAKRGMYSFIFTPVPGPKIAGAA